MSLKDVQSQRDFRNININKVGVKGVKYPITLLDKKNGLQHTIADINMYVLLPSKFKGTHMSRFIEIINENKNEINIKKIHHILSQMKTKLNAQKAYLEINFDYFIEKQAPVSKIKSLMSYTCGLYAFSGDADELTLFVKVPVTSLCPCSKEISDYGAHNQRAFVSVYVKFTDMVWIEDIISIVEANASSDIYCLLKRPDEKFVTEKAYNNPMFVEDIARNIVKDLKLDKRIYWYKVEVESLESIHNHNAYACIEKN
ncbi:MAG: GTP cyclohydrolase FolE2 [Desulfurella sp.]|uniref:GTP cyclohydrolase FolE2 n=1 Tax=Desulfurella multipotens TaxID=79269 RepID=A0A1G6M445_9BACT|nr:MULTISPECIES: GTP cyclohydrolase FolE2 [Desulfurella]AHF96944.1 GTP cyclohydrolase [Desulfurella acetivorans A63]PMP93132.1 MAG: GTP cyclohydrolase I FolE2 [Desulfurella sp.]SDC50211.1 GTP cyclohydrolase I [Desulfurella multipotens]